MQNCCLFCLCLSFRIKVKKRYFFWKKSGIFSFRVNDILTSILSALYPFLTLPNDVLQRKRGTFFSVSSDLMKGTKRYLFCSWKRCSQKREKGTFLAVGSDVLKSAKKVPLIVFSRYGKPFRILLIDRCHINRCLFAKFETNCWAWHCNMYSVRSQF